MSYTSYTPQTNSPCLSKAPFYLHRYTSLESWGKFSPAKLLGLPPWSCHGQVTPCCPSQSHNDQGCSSYSTNAQLHSKANFLELVCAMALPSDFCSAGCLGFLLNSHQLWCRRATIMTMVFLPHWAASSFLVLVPSNHGTVHAYASS